MKGIPALSLNRLKRTAAAVGVGALVLAGAALLGTTQAHAADTQFGSGTGLTITPATAAAGAGDPTYNSAACPTNFQGSAVLLAIDPTTPAGTTEQNTNAQQVAPPNSAVSVAFSGTFSLTMDSLESDGINVAAGVQFEIADYCYTAANATGPGEYGPSTFVTIAADGSYIANQTMTGPAQTVNLTLSASPNPATSGQLVTLTATASVASATGTVQFENNGSDINNAVTLSGGTASTTFTAPTETATTDVALTAVYTPTGNFTAGTAGSLSLPVNPPPTNPTTASGQIPLAVTVPLSGTFSLTVNTTTWVVLGVNSAGTTATGATTPVVVTDTYNSYPGWSVTGEATQWTGVTNTSTETPSGYPAATDIPADHGSQTIPADQLGWAPTNTGTLPTGVTLGNAITAGTSPNGLGDSAQTLATGTPGSGSYTGTSGVTLGANLTLAIPAGQEEGPYAAFLNIDATSGTP
jgi:trimeric autotransporter adhesin